VCTLLESPIMTTRSATLTVRVSPEIKKRLGRLATHTQRTKSYLAGEAIATFVEQELSVIEGIQRGLDDMHAGRVVPHKTAMRRLRATVARAPRKNRE
jgi:predicted transcriptional regulator